jgi:hypothetical protein
VLSRKKQTPSAKATDKNYLSAFRSSVIFIFFFH